MKNYTKTALAILALIAGALFLLQSCMETTSPSDNNEREITVLVYQVTSAAGVPGSKVPLRNVDVSAFPSDGTGTVLQGRTNDKGAVVFLATIPKIGVLYDFVANYNNRIQTKSQIIICSDTTIVFVFDSAQVQMLNCVNLNLSEIMVFTDDNGSEIIRQNTPPNVNRYDKCLAGFFNAGTDDITVTIPAVSAPFTLQSVMLDGIEVQQVNGTVVVKPGQTFTMCYSVSTANVKDFIQNLAVGLRCQSSTGTYNVQLRAKIEPPSCDCDANNTSSSLDLLDRVPVGQSGEVEQIVYTNNSPCDVTINRTAFDGNDGWQIISPQFPVTLQKGQSLTVRAKFTASRAAPGRDTLKLLIVPAGTTNQCPFDVNLTGEGCSSSCPFVSMDAFIYNKFSGVVFSDTLSDRVDKRVFLSIANLNPPIISSVTRLFYFKNPDSACTEVTLNVSVQFPNNDSYSPQFFTVSPQVLTLAPGEIGVVQVTFSAPDFEYFQKTILPSRRANPPYTTADSAFNVQLIVQSPGCRQQINATAVVTAFPDLSPIINLRPYSQRTPFAPEPENEVYYFGQGARTIIKAPGNKPGPYPPPRGDIWIDVADTLATANPPQMPILKTVNNSIGMKIWQTNMPESQFTNVAATYIAFVNDPNYSTGYSTNPITPLTVRDVIAFKMNQFTYGLIYIRSVNTGVEATSSKQSGIEFRSIYPIYIP